MKPDEKARKLIDAYWRARPLGKRPSASAMQQFRERLAEALDLLGEIGANDCGDLTAKQAALFQQAVAKLVNLAEQVAP